MSDTLYDVGFQIHLLKCMLRSPALWRMASENLRVSDFGPSYLQFVYEVARAYVGRYGGLPSTNTLFVVIENTMNNGDPEIKTIVSPMEHTPLATLLEEYAVFTPTEADIKFCEANLGGFWAAVRWLAETLAGGSSFDKLKKAAELSVAMGSLQKKTFTMSNGLDEVPEEESASGQRWGWGVPTIDAMLGGGIMRKQAQIVIAGTGVGKTTSMTGSTAANTMMGTASAYFTLEMTAARIMERYQGILGGIPANLFKKKREFWPECYRKRFAALIKPSCKLKPYMTVVDMAAQPHCVADIDEGIKLWKDGMDKQGFDADQLCANVYIDWLDRLDPKGLPGVTRNTTEERIYFKFTEALYQLANKHNLCVTVATQAKPEAKGKERLTAKDVAWGYAKQHMMDVSIAFAPIITEPEEEGKGKVGIKAKGKAGPAVDDNSGYDTITVNMPECDREMNACFLKTRDTAAVDTFVRIYQDPTLRLWSSKPQAVRRKEAIERDPYDGIRGFISD